MQGEKKEKFENFLAQTISLFSSPSALLSALV